MKLRVKRVRDGALLPTRSHSTDAGFDLYASEGATLWGGDAARVCTGVALEIPDGHYARVLGRSSLAAKGVVVLGGVIDAGYRGEVVVHLVHLGRELLEVEVGDRVAQLVVMALPAVELVEADELGASSRATGGHGSTGR